MNRVFTLELQNKYNHISIEKKRAVLGFFFEVRLAKSVIARVESRMLGQKPKKYAPPAKPLLDCLQICNKAYVGNHYTERQIFEAVEGKMLLQQPISKRSKSRRISEMMEQLARHYTLGRQQKALDFLQFRYFKFMMTDSEMQILAQVMVEKLAVKTSLIEAEENSLY